MQSPGARLCGSFELQRSSITVGGPSRTGEERRRWVVCASMQSAFFHVAADVSRLIFQNSSEIRADSCPRRGGALTALPFSLARFRTRRLGPARRAVLLWLWLR